VNEVPITSVTNGVHIKSWLSEEMNSLYERYLGSKWTDDIVDKSFWKNIDQIPDEELWRTHQRGKERLVAFARRRLKAQMLRRGTYHTELNWAEEVLDPEALTIGFARRFATYKRGNLLLKDPQRFIKLLNDPKQPIQIIFAGKAHPRDSEGKEIIRQIIHFAAQYDVRRRLVFLEDYDINVARFIMHGVDVWLNNPRPPMEASGTSGMKAAFNGALNMSTLDGWWCEGYKPEGGWAIGCGERYDDAAYQDIVESKAMYNILENEIIPLFYTRSADNLPRAWIHRMRNSIKWITPQFNTNRMVRDYTRRFYNPAASKWRYLTAEAMARVKAFSMWKSNLKTLWREFDIKDVQIEATGGLENERLNPRQPQLKVGSNLGVKALVKLGKVEPDNISVELYHGPVDSWGNITNGSAIKMECQGSVENALDGEYWFTGQMPCQMSGRQGIAVRVLPKHVDLVNPYELGLILWENTNNCSIKT
jgi:starch phosphorylase